MNIRDGDDIQNLTNYVHSLTPESLDWKPIYSKNMLSNGIAGYYALILFMDEAGNCSGRKYSILYQYEEDPRHLGEGLLAYSKKIELYILFEKTFPDFVGPLEYPESRKEAVMSLYDAPRMTLADERIGDYGRFVRAYPSLELAKKRAAMQFRAAYGCAMLDVILDDDGQC